MDIGDFVYVLIGVIWLIYSFLKRGSKKTTSEQPVEEYLPSEVMEQVEDPYETVQKEILVLSEPVVSEAEPDEREESYIENLKGATQTPAPTLTHSFQKKRKVLRTNPPLPFGEEPGEGLADFDLRKAVVYYEILKRPEY